MQSIARQSASLIACLVLCLSGCGEDAGTSAPPPSPRQVVQRADNAAAAADEDKIEAAESALAGARLLSMRMGDPTPEVQAALGRADRALGLARERAALRRLMRGLKARSYVVVRDPTLKLAFVALGSAAKLADGSTLDKLPPPARVQAEAAADAVRAMFPGDPAGEDWKAVAARLENLDEDAPQFRMLLALAWLLSAHDRLALAEIAQADVEQLKDPQQRLALLAVRSCIYQVNDLRLLAGQDVAAIEAAVGADNDQKLAREYVAGIHLVMAVVALMDDDRDAADRYLVRANRFWPNNPVSVYLTGEILAADGNREAAAASLEASAKGTEHEQVARLLAQRARELRDGKAGTRLIDHRALLVALVREELKIAASKTEGVRSLRDWFTAAASLGPRMLDFFKLGSDEPEPDTQVAGAQRPARWAVPITDRPGLGNLHKITDNLYRGEQPTPEGFDSLKKMGIRTVINLRTLHSDREQCNRVGLDYVHIDCQAWEGEDDEVVEFLRIATDPKRQPVFFHCQHGADRTGTMAAVYRMVVEDWSNEDALKEMTAGGYGFHAVWQNLIVYVDKMEVDKFKKAITPSPPAVATQ